MLCFSRYNDLWTNPAPNGFNQRIAPPCYHEYVQREIYKQDYLDLFKGKLTYERIKIFTPSGIRFGILITGNPLLMNLGIPHHELYILHNEEKKYLLVDYDYPWTKEELDTKRCIKYIMIGEAAPTYNPVIVAYGENDGENTYFYNHLHSGNTRWLTAPVGAFEVVAKKKDKRAQLIGLANIGYILFDLFPFAVNYSKVLRELLNENETSNHFYKELVSQLNALIQQYLCHSAIMAFSGPPTIHHYLAHQIATGSLGIPAGVVCHSYPNSFAAVPPIPIAPIALPAILIPWPVAGSLNGNYLNLTYLKKVPYFRCCCYDGAIVGGPNQLFIRNAFA